MIEDREVEELSENLTLKGVVEFFDENGNELVHFYHASDIGKVEVDTLHMFGERELIVPYRKNERGSFLVINNILKLL